MKQSNKTGGQIFYEELQRKSRFYKKSPIFKGDAPINLGVEKNWLELSERERQIYNEAASYFYIAYSSEIEYWTNYDFHGGRDSENIGVEWANGKDETAQKIVDKRFFGEGGC